MLVSVSASNLITLESAYCTKGPHNFQRVGGEEKDRESEHETRGVTRT